MTGFTVRHEEPVAAWYLAALLTAAGCEQAKPPLSTQAPTPAGCGLPADRTANRPAEEPYRLTTTALVPCHELTGAGRKTWHVVKAEWDGHPTRPPFHALTFFAGGGWRDSSCVGGIWRFDPHPNRLYFELGEFEALISAEVLQLTEDRLVIEFANYAPSMVLTLTPSNRMSSNE
ncbi:MAG: hypothetical protein KatS3mg111_1949 [Pirellulaceae bacterium]|nr:MAG: hypothetical protein KatS3mg111_1949 [Pirellulaceae bacterium]